MNNIDLKRLNRIKERLKDDKHVIYLGQKTHKKANIQTLFWTIVDGEENINFQFQKTVTRKGGNTRLRV